MSPNTGYASLGPMDEKTKAILDELKNNPAALAYLNEGNRRGRRSRSRSGSRSRDNRRRRRRDHSRSRSPPRNRRRSRRYDDYEVDDRRGRRNRDEDDEEEPERRSVPRGHGRRGYFNQRPHPDKNKRATLLQGLTLAKQMTYLPNRNSYNYYEAKKKQYTQFKSSTTGRDFLEFQRDVVIFTHILETYEDEETTIITGISLGHLKELKSNLIEQYTVNPFTNKVMQKWNAHLGKLVKDLIKKLKNDDTRPAHITLIDEKLLASTTHNTDETDKSWMEDSDEETLTETKAPVNDADSDEEQDQNPKTKGKSKQKGRGRPVRKATKKPTESE